jgi:MYXO-CTERM domain-containing protein
MAWRFAMAGLFGAAVAAAPAPARSELLLRTIIPNAALSIDAVGQFGGVEQVQADVPAGSTVVMAYLYTASVWNKSPLVEVGFGVGSVHPWLYPSAGTILSPNRNPATTVLHDVTSIVKPVIDAGPGGIYNFSVAEVASDRNDGSVLVVAYRNAATQGHTALVLDGELATTGDTTLVEFPQPYKGGDFIMSLASSYSSQPTGQFTSIDVETSGNPTSRRLSNCAGGPDDGQNFDGGLITVGGVGDNTGNPNPACSSFAGPRVDDELYNLAAGNSANPAPFISTGDTWLRLNTLNLSNNDNVFGLFITAAGLNAPPNPVSEPPAAALMAIALLGLTALRRRWLS